MAAYSKKILTEQENISSVVRALTGLTVLRLAQTNKILDHMKSLRVRLDESISRVFEVYPLPADTRKIRIDAVRADPGLNPNPLYIFLASNQELYGELIAAIGAMFLEDLQKSPSDALVIGKIGKLIVDNAHVTNKVTYLDLDDDKPDEKKLEAILSVIRSYSRVVVYYGKSDSILRQSPTKSELERTIPNLNRPRKKYMFEPTPRDVLNFLQLEVSFNSFHQKVFEAQQARLNARRWTWTKQQLARQRFLNQMRLEAAKYRKELAQKQQQVALSAQRLGSDNVISVV